MPESSDTPSIRHNILTEAEAAVYGERQTSYGHPAENFQRTADLWNGWLKARGHTVVLDTFDVAQMMVMLKQARLINTPNHRDSWVDGAGYFAAGARAAGVDA